MKKKKEEYELEDNIANNAFYKISDALTRKERPQAPEVEEVDDDPYFKDLEQKKRERAAKARRDALMSVVKK